jgi:hypothetical protein
VPSYPAGMTVSSRALTTLADALRQRRTQRGTRWRRLDVGTQALLVVAHLRKGDAQATWRSASASARPRSTAADARRWTCTSIRSGMGTRPHRRPTLVLPGQPGNSGVALPTNCGARRCMRSRPGCPPPGEPRSGATRSSGVRSRAKELGTWTLSWTRPTPGRVRLSAATACPHPPCRLVPDADRQ